MFIRLAALLLLTSTVFVTTTKFHDVLKEVDKRYIDWGSALYTIKDFGRKNRVHDWMNLSDEEALKKKKEYAENVVYHFREMSSSENKYFHEALKWVSTNMSPDMTSQVCGDDKVTGAYQYIKFMAGIGSRYKKFEDLPELSYDVLESSRDTLEVNIKLNQKQLLGSLHNTVYFDIKMNLTMRPSHNPALSDFSIVHISHGGSCIDHGTYRYSMKDDDTDFVKNLKSHPRGISFIRAFTPKIFNALESDPTQIPQLWLKNGLKPHDSIIRVCHDGVTDPVTYNYEQFFSWFNRFRMMWHPKKDTIEDFIKSEIIDVDDKKLHARLTMTLQMGRNESVATHDWNFKLFLKPNDTGHWYIHLFEVLCTPTVDYKNESLRAMSEVVTEAFLETVRDVPKPALWYSQIDFLQKFSQDGRNDIEAKFCRHAQAINFTQLQKDMFLINYHKERSGFSGVLDCRNATYTDKPIAADRPLGGTIHFRMNLLCTRTDKEDPTIYEQEWTILVKWDEKDQFYYIWFVVFECSHHIHRFFFDLPEPQSLQ